jgi:hypothetical protein
VETIRGVKYAMASAVMVENITARNDNCGVCAQESDTCSFEWLETDAVCQFEPDNVVETIEFLEYVCQVAQQLGFAFAETATCRRYVNGELETEITKSLLSDVTPVLTESEYKMLNVSDVETRVEAVVFLFDLETVEPEYLNGAIIENVECMNPEYVPVTFEDALIEYEYDDDKIMREDLDIRTGGTYPGTNGIGLVQKTINPADEWTTPTDFTETAATLYWSASQSFVINGKTYRRNDSWPQRLPAMSIMPVDSSRWKATFPYVFTVPETKEYMFIAGTDNYSWVYIDGNPVFEKSDSAANSAFVRAYAFKVFLSAGTHLIENVWQNTGPGGSFGTVAEIYDCTWEELAYNYASLQAARDYLTPHLVFSTGQYFTDVNDNPGNVATGILPLVYISDGDKADGWELILENGEARGARRLTETPTGFEIASHLKLWVAGVPADIDGNPCAVSGKPQAIVINAGSFAGAAAGNIVGIDGVPYQVEDIFLMPEDLYTNPVWHTTPVLWNGVIVAQYTGD